MKKLIATIALATAALTANAGSYYTCLNASIVTNFGISSPSYMRQCFNSKMTQSQVDQAAANAGFSKVMEKQYTTVYQSSDGWLFSVKSSNGSYVSEVILLLDSGT